MIDNSEEKRKSSVPKLVAIIILFLMIVGMAVIYAVSDYPKGKSERKVVDNGNASEVIVSDNTLIYDSQMQAIILELDVDEKTMVLKSISDGDEYYLDFIGGTQILDKYEKVISVGQLAVGQIVDAFYIEDDNKLVKVQISPNAWEQIGLTGLIINEEKGIISFNGQRHPLSSEVVVIDDSEPITLSDILVMDYVTLRGVDSSISVVVLTKGHGYIELAKDEEYIGGMLYVGTEIITEITENMVVPVRIGTYDVTVINKNISGSESFTIVKNETTTFDVSQYGKPAIKTGMVRFTVNPSAAILYIDGVQTDHISPIELTYGEHALEVSLGGYVTYEGTIVVNSTDRTFNIMLPENSANNSNGNTDNASNDDSNNNWNYEDNSDDHFNEEENDSGEEDIDYGEDDDYDGNDDSEEDVDDNTSDGSDTGNSGGTIGGVDAERTLTISCNDNTLVYIDDNYVGKITNGTLVTKKYTGMHTIKLVLSGYGEKTYTIDLDNDGEDAVLKFPAFY